MLDVSWQSCRVHFMRKALAHAGKSGRRVVSAFIATAFAQDDAEAVRAQWRHIADQFRPKLPKLASLGEAKTDVVACMTFPTQHRIKPHSTTPIERLNCETKRWTELVGISPNEAAIVRLAGAVLFEQNDEWAVQRARYMTIAPHARDIDRLRNGRRTSRIVTVVNTSSETWPFEPHRVLLSHERRDAPADVTEVTFHGRTRTSQLCLMVPTHRAEAPNRSFSSFKPTI